MNKTQEIKALLRWSRTLPEGAATWMAQALRVLGEENSLFEGNVPPADKQSAEALRAFMIEGLTSKAGEPIAAILGGGLIALARLRQIANKDDRWRIGL